MGAFCSRAIWKDRRLARETARRNEAVAVPDPRVTGSAINVEALAAPFENFFGHGKWHVVAGIVAGFPGVEIRVFMQLTPRYRAFDRRTLGALIGEKVAARKWILPRLHVHVDAAAGEQGDRRQRGDNGNLAEALHFSWAPPKSSAVRGLAENCACRRDRTWDRKKTRSRRNGLSKPTRNAER